MICSLLFFKVTPERIIQLLVGDFCFIGGGGGGMVRTGGWLHVPYGVANVLHLLLTFRIHASLLTNSSLYYIHILSSFLLNGIWWIQVFLCRIDLLRLFGL